MHVRLKALIYNSYSNQNSYKIAKQSLSIFLSKGVDIVCEFCIVYTRILYVCLWNDWIVGIFFDHLPKAHCNLMYLTISSKTISSASRSLVRGPGVRRQQEKEDGYLREWPCLSNVYSHLFYKVETIFWQDEILTWFTYCANALPQTK